MSFFGPKSVFLSLPTDSQLSGDFDLDHLQRFAMEPHRGRGRDHQHFSGRHRNRRRSSSYYHRKKYFSQIWDLLWILTSKWGFVQISLFFSSITMNFCGRFFPTFGFSSIIFDLSSTHLDFLSVVFPQFGFSANLSHVFHN